MMGQVPAPKDPEVTKGHVPKGGTPAKTSPAKDQMEHTSSTERGLRFAPCTIKASAAQTRPKGVAKTPEAISATSVWDLTKVSSAHAPSDRSRRVPPRLGQAPNVRRRPQQPKPRRNLHPRRREHRERHTVTERCPISQALPPGKS